MPRYHKHKKVGDGRCTVAVRPMGSRRFFRFWPYYNGSDVNLTIFIKNTSQEKCRLSYEYILYRCNEPKDKMLPPRVADVELEPKEPYKKKISEHLIEPGEYYARLNLSESGEDLAEGLYMASFKILSHDEWISNFITVVIASVISLIIGIVIGLIIG